MQIDPEFKKLIPTISTEEYAQLEANILKDGCRDPLVVWQDTLIDGHNRHGICTKHGLLFKMVGMEFADRDEVKIWIINNQLGRRNLPDFVRFELKQKEKEILLAKGQEKKHEDGKIARDYQLGVLSTIDKTPSHNTQKEIAEKLNWSTGKVAQAEVVIKKASEKIKEKLRQGDLTINKAYKDIKREEVREKQKAISEHVESVAVIKNIKPVNIKTGQFWRLGRHTLYCGDTSKEEFISRAPQGAFAFADPPYNAGVADWDNDFIWQHDWLIDKAKIVAVTPGIVSIFDFARKTNMPYVWSVACWINNGKARGAMGFGNWIYAAIFSGGSIYSNSQDFLQVSINTAESTQTNHRGRKPAGLLVWLIDKFTNPGEIIIDPFLGSGTTLLAAETTGRFCFGGEINPEYCADITARWEKQTGGKAVLIDGEDGLSA